MYLYFLSRELARMGHSPTILVGSPEPWPMPWAKTVLVENLNLWGVRRNFILAPTPWRILRPLNFFEFIATRFGFFPEMLIFSLRALQLLRGNIPGSHFDIIHDVQSLGYGLLMMKRFHRPLVATIHHPLTIDFQASLERDRNFTERYYTVVFYPLGMQSRVVRRCDRVLTSSQETAREIQRAFRVDADKIRMFSIEGPEEVCIQSIGDHPNPIRINTKGALNLAGRFLGGSEDPKIGRASCRERV